VEVTGWSFGAAERVRILFIDSTRGTNRLAKMKTDGTGSFATLVTIPDTATPGEQWVRVKGKISGSGQTAKRTFTVT
jgi:hypothetical protein